MEEIFLKFEKTIKTKHSVSFAPKYVEKFRTLVDKKIFIAIAEKTFKRLGWDVVFQNENSIEAKRREKSFGQDRWTEMITSTFEYGNVTVKSESLGNEMWDAGKNSKRVKLFIYAFQETLKAYDKNALKELEKEIDSRNNWEDYVIPESMPLPKKNKKPDILLPIIGGVILALSLGVLLAFISLKGIYVIGLFEFLVAVVMVWGMKLLIKISNFTDFTKIQYLLASMILITYVSNQYFQYEIILNENNLDRIGFLEFINIRLSEGLTVKKLNTGAIGLIISWILQLGLTGLIVYLRIVSVLTEYLINRVPTEILDYAVYLFVKQKPEDEVRNELAKKGWADKANQDEVFEAIGALQSAVELNRIK